MLIIKKTLPTADAFAALCMHAAKITSQFEIVIDTEGNGAIARGGDDTVYCEAVSYYYMEHQEENEEGVAPTMDTLIFYR